VANLIANPGADGRISLREAILATNATAGANNIRFGIPLTDANHLYYQDDGIPGLSNVQVTPLADLSTPSSPVIANYDVNYPPGGEPLYWEEFKEWASANIPEYSLAVIDEQVADPVTAAALQSYRAGRTATRFGYPAGTQGLADFRAAERTFQLLTQVVGRAGRGDVPGDAIIQTLYPDHYSVQAAAAQDYATFYRREMEFRRAMHYPPTIAMINVIVRGRTLEGALADAHELVTRVRQHGGVGRVLGPAPAALSKIKDEYRAQFFLKGARRQAMRGALAAALDAQPELKRKTMVDVDPVNVL
jgi:hypothetical protein